MDRSLQDPELSALMRQAGVAYTSSDFKNARKLYSQGLQLSGAAQLHFKALNLVGLGNCQVVAGEYPDALRSFRQSLEIAESHGYKDVLLKAGVGLVSVYRRIPDLQAAQHTLNRIEPIVLRSQDPAALAQAASVARDLDFPKSQLLYRTAIQASSIRGDMVLDAALWNQLGYSNLIKGHLPDADRALTEAYRLRLMAGKRQLQPTLLYLGWLRRLQGRYSEAISLLNAARERRGDAGAMPVYAIDYQLALTCQGLGLRREALNLFDRAFIEIETSRRHSLSAESFRVSAEEGLQGLIGQYVNAGMSEYERTGDQKLAFRMLVIAENSRYRLFGNSDINLSRLPQDYVRTMAEYRSALARATVATPGADVSAEVARLRLELANQESEAGRATSENSPKIFEKDTSTKALQGIQNSLNPSEALISFHLSEHGSFVWAIMRDKLEGHRLTSSAQLKTAMTSYRQHVHQPSAATTQAARVLSSMLFGELRSTALQKPNLIFSLDGPLFGTPLSTLPDSTGVPLARNHSLRQVPTTLVLTRQVASAATGTAFVGLADPVYNPADSRYKGKPPGGSELRLTRLPNSARELRRCAAAWKADGNHVLLTGTQVTRENLLAQIGRAPAVLHFGTHVLPNPAAPEQVMIALGLRPNGSGDYLAPADLFSLHKPVGLVTLSGCDSGSGRAYAGLGIQGLTRAWLLAGAKSVLATYWPIPDDEGDLLAVMYEELSKAGGHTGPREVAHALHLAQMKMASSSGSQADPSYWGAFFVAGKE